MNLLHISSLQIIMQLHSFEMLRKSKVTNSAEALDHDQIQVLWGKAYSNSAHAVLHFTCPRASNASSHKLNKVFLCFHLPFSMKAATRSNRWYFFSCLGFYSNIEQSWFLCFCNESLPSKHLRSENTGERVGSTRHILYPANCLSSSHGIPTSVTVSGKLNYLKRLSFFFLPSWMPGRWGIHGLGLLLRLGIRVPGTQSYLSYLSFRESHLTFCHSFLADKIEIKIAAWRVKTVEV